MNTSKLEILIKKEDLKNKIKELADQLNEKYKNESLTVIAILNGALFFFSDLLKLLKMPIQIDTIVVSSYDGTKSTDKIVYHKKIVKPIVENQNVIIIEDIIDTGNTMNSVYEYVKSLKPKTLDLVVLASKEDSKTNFKYDFKSLFLVPDKYIVGYGFGIDDLYRQLEDVYIINE